VEERGDNGLVGLDLVVGLPDGGCMVSRVLELYHDEGETVYEEDDIGPLVLVVLLDGELVYGEEDVIAGVLEVNEPDPLSPFLAVLLYGYRDALGEEPVEGLVGVDELGGEDG